MHHLAAAVQVTTMNTGAAAVAVTAALALGWYISKLHTANGDVTSARARLAGALKAVWAARRVGAVVVVVGIVLVDLWVRGKGR